MKFTRTNLIGIAAMPVLGAVGLGLWMNSHREEQSNSPEVAVLTQTGEQVGRIEHLTCEVAKGWPVILVRDANERSPWWVQALAESEGANKYKARVHFGNEKTESGQKYQIVVLSTPDASQAQQFEAGTTLDGLPEDVPHSDPVVVVRR